MTVWAMGLAGVLAGVVFPSSASAAVPTRPGAYASVTPTRLLDTRSVVGGHLGAVAPLGTVALKVTGGNVPADASAVVLNVTVTSPTKAGFITVFRAGKAQPGVSNLNFTPGQTIANTVVAPVGAGGVVNLYNGSAGSTQIVADVFGYHVAGAAPTDAGAYVPLDPSRLLDTRSAVGGHPGAVAPIGKVDLQRGTCRSPASPSRTSQSCSTSHPSGLSAVERPTKDESAVRPSEAQPRAKRRQVAV